MAKYMETSGWANECATVVLEVLSWEWWWEEESTAAEEGSWNNASTKAVHSNDTFLVQRISKKKKKKYGFRKQFWNKTWKIMKFPPSTSSHPVRVLRSALWLGGRLPGPPKQPNFTKRLLRRKHMYLPAAAATSVISSSLASFPTVTGTASLAHLAASAAAAAAAFGVFVGVWIAGRKDFFQLVRSPTGKQSAGLSVFVILRSTKNKMMYVHVTKNDPHTGVSVLKPLSLLFYAISSFRNSAAQVFNCYIFMHNLFLFVEVWFS